MRFLIALALFSLPAFAAEEIRWQQHPGGPLELYSLHTEPGQYVLDRFEKREGAFQQLRDHRAFGEEALARKEFDFLTKNFHEGKPPLMVLADGRRTAPGTIWPVTEAWNAEWEQKFSDWIAHETGPDFFQRFRISTDCADAAYAFRWIFARIHGLPAANHLSVTGDLLTNETLLPEWETIPAAPNWQDDQRFRAALNYLLDNTYTHSLMGDLYPVAITRAGTQPGTIFLHLYNAETGHTEILYQIKESNHPAPLRMLASNVPRTVRELAEYGMLDWGSLPRDGESGLLRFRWAVKADTGWSLAPAASMPNYSTEQFDPRFADGRMNFVDAVTHKLIPDWKPDSAAVMREKASTLLTKLSARVKVVTDGFQYCSTHQGGCPEGSADWETWSTPSRDAAIGRLAHEVQDLADDSMCSPGCAFEFEQMKGKTLAEIQNRSYTAGDAVDTWKDKLYSSDPNATVPARWGR